MHGTFTWAAWIAKHIEYDINTFAGCSGTAVFLLDEKSDNQKQSPGSSRWLQEGPAHELWIQAVGFPGWRA